MKDEQLFKLVGKRIRQLRLDRGWTQGEFSQRFGFNFKHYQRIEQGQQNLELATLNKLAAAFGVPIDEILVFLPASIEKHPCAEKHKGQMSRVRKRSICSYVDGLPLMAMGTVQSFPCWFIRAVPNFVPATVQRSSQPFISTRDAIFANVVGTRSSIASEQ